MMEGIIDVKIGRKDGAFWVQCPKCLKDHFGNALDGSLRSRVPIRCDETGRGCKVLLRIHE